MKKKWLLMVVALAMSASMASCDLFTSASSTPDSTESVQSSVTESTPEESTPTESTPTESSPTESTPEESSPEDSSPEDSSPEDSSPEDSSPEDGGDEGDGPVVETYLVKFVDSEGNVISEAWLEEGEMPEAPTNVAVPDNTEFVTYTGAWDKEIAEVSGAVTYTWVVTASKVMVTVTFDGANETQVAKGETVNAPSMQQPGKVVSGWKVDGEAVDLSTYVVTAPVNFESVWAEVPYATSGENYMNACELPDAPGKWYYEIGSQETVLDWTVALPTMAYEEGKTITYNWVGGAWILVGINGNSVQGQGVGSEGAISITNVGGVLLITIENTANPATISGSINDQDVIAGNKPLTLSVNNGARYNHFFLSKDATVTDSTIKVETFVVDYLGNKEIATEKDGVITYYVSEKHGDAENGKFGDILIPKMDYTQNQCVTLNWKLSGWTMFGIDTNLWFMAQGEAVNGTATLTYNEKDGTLNAWVESGGTGYSYQWTDRDIIEGRKSVDFGFYAWSPQMIFISDIKVVESVTVTFDGGYEQKVVIGSTVTPPDIAAPAGKVFNCWTLNGEKVDFSTFVVTENVNFVSVWDEVPYAESAAGAALNASYGAATEGYWWFRVGEFDAAVWTVNLPKQAYTDGKMTTFNWIFGDWCKIGFAEGNWLDLPGNQSAEGTLTVTNNGGTLTLVLTKTITGESLTTTIADADVVAGNKGLTLTINAGAPYRHFNITNGVEGEIPVIPEEPVVTEYPAGIYDADGKLISEATLTDDGASYSFGDGITGGSLVLPKIDFTKYTTVEYDWTTNGYIQFGMGTALWWYDSGSTMTGHVVLTYADGALTFTATKEGAKTRTLTITDEDIIKGNKGFVMNFNSLADYRQVTISNLTKTEPAEPEVPVEVRPSFAGSQTIYADGTTAEAMVGENDVNFSVANGTDASIALPCIDYTKYQVIMFNWSVSNGWIPFSCVSGSWYFNSGVVYYGTATLTYVNGELKVVMNSPVEGGGVREITITDAEILNGQKPLTFYYLGWADGSITLSNMQVYDYAINLAGAQWVDADGTHDATVSGNNVTYAITNGKDGTVYLPCLDFTKYSVVTFEWIATGGWIPFSCVSGSWYFNSGVVYHGTATLTYANGELKVVMNSPVEGGGVREITITDAEIINGQKAVPFYYLGWGAGSISFSDMRATK